MNNINSIKLFEEAQKYIPGGVNSPVRAFKSVGLSPLYIEKGRGAYIYDSDGNGYIDYVGSWGPLILGHLHPEVIGAISECLAVGTSFGAPTERETTLARMIVEAMPSVEMVRLVNSGTEAAMSAARLARAYTKRKKIIKFEGCYHGHADTFLIKAGSGALTHGVPTSPGVIEETAAHTINATFNDLEGLEQLFKSSGEEIAAVIVEPVPGNMGVVPPQPGFLQGLRDLASRYGSLLIFDEVITGFRLSYGGAQSLYGVMPDITCMGKIIGGGLPVGAYGGRKEIMSMLSPSGPVYQAGTLSGNPLAVSAGIAALKILGRPGFYEELDGKASRMAIGLSGAARKAGVEVCFNRVGSMLCGFFTKGRVTDFKTACDSDTRKYSVFFRSMLEQGVYLAPSQFEAAFISLAHTNEIIDKTLEAASRAFEAVANTSF
ncbi:MAG: glutamate-1-semialdehyde aminotransferase [Peptococcaceae bacterium BRH_c4a]|nr:MAG: glutamate-1-semialdehyde aminotransferase [Peptococcaceae bacterium BRH_c4a]